MEDIISKELLSEVLGTEVVYIETDKDELYRYWSLDEEQCENYIGYRITTGVITKNIHEIAHKCKLKAIEWGFVLVEYPHIVKIHKNGRSIVEEEIKSITSYPYCSSRAIKACQWIFENKDK